MQDSLSIRGGGGGGGGSGRDVASGLAFIGIVGHDCWVESLAAYNEKS